MFVPDGAFCITKRPDESVCAAAAGEPEKSEPQLSQDAPVLIAESGLVGT
jgi:hypothetical protein